MELTKTDKLASKEKRTNQPDSGAMIRRKPENQKLFCQKAVWDCIWAFMSKLGWRDDFEVSTIFYSIACCYAQFIVR
jgi:hypothetical protein